MQSSETRRKHVPGTREISIEIKQITDSINAIDAEIKMAQERIHSIISAEKSASPRAKILNELNQVTQERNALNGEKRNYSNLARSARTEIDAIRSEKANSSLGFNSVEKINKAIEDLEMKLISTSISAKVENEISESLSSLKMQKEKFDKFESKFAKVETLEANLKEYKAKISELVKELAEKNAAIDSLKADLAKLSEGGKVKSPEITKLDGKIEALKAQKNELFGQRNAKREKIHELEQEFSKLEAEILIQKQLEEQKDEIRKIIEGLKQEKESILSEKESYDPKIFDSIIFSLKKLSGSKTFNVNIDLATLLLKHKVPIPYNQGSLDSTIQSLEQKKKDSISDLKQKNDDFVSVLAAINSKIENEMNKLNALPPTNMDILRRAFRADPGSKIRNK